MPTIAELKKQNQYLTMPEEQIWIFLESHKQQIASLTTINKKGWPVTIPIIFLAHNKKIYFNAFKWKGNVLHKKVRDIANNPIVSIMSEAGWNDVPRTPNRFVCVVGTAKVVADPNLGTVSYVESFWHKFQAKYPNAKLPSEYAGVPKEQEHIYFEVTPLRCYSQDGITMQRLIEKEQKDQNQPD